MNFLGGRNWPPPWMPKILDSKHVEVGEIGILEGVHPSTENGCKCHLTISYKGHTYTGILLYWHSSIRE
jgi:hypothetical protein